MKKRRVTNEEIAKILHETIIEHTKELKQNKKAMAQVSIEIQKHILEAESIDFKPDLTEIKNVFNELEKQTEESVTKIQKTIKTPNYLLYSVFGMIAIVLISSFLTIYAFNSKAELYNQIHEYEEMKTYFQKFLKESRAGKEAFDTWKK